MGNVRQWVNVSLWYERQTWWRYDCVMASRGGKKDASGYLDDYHEGLLWRLIAAKGLDANDFRVGASELRGYEWKLSHEPTGWAVHALSGYALSYDADLLRTRPDGDPVADEHADLNDYLTIVRDWADELKSAKPGRQRRGGGPMPIGSADGQLHHENTPFTPAERAEIVNQLRAIRDSVRKNYRLSAEQLEAIDKRLEEAEEASKRLGRKDWKSMFYGIVFGLMVNDAISSDVAQHILLGSSMASRTCSGPGLLQSHGCWAIRPEGCPRGSRRFEPR
jgi:hypothetical protein